MFKFMLLSSGHDHLVHAVFLVRFSSGVFVLQESYVDLCLVYSIMLWFGVSSWIILFGS